MRKTLLRRLGTDEKGASAVEYAILVGVLGALIATAATSFGGDLSNAFSGLATKAKIQ